MLRRDQILNFPNLLLLVLTVVNLLLQTVPLTNVLHYEYSAVNGILQSFLGGISAIYFINKNSHRKEVQYNIFLTNFKFLLTLTFSQFILGFVSNLFFQICPISDGIWFYFVITIPAFFIGIISGILAFSISQRFSYLLFIVIWLIILLAPLPELYSNPQMYFYNSIIGFFPGTIYDEDIAVNSTLIYYRLANLIFFILIFISINNRKLYSINNFRSIRLLIIIIVILSFSLLKPFLGFSSDTNRIEKSLKGKIESQNFIIIYHVELSKTEVDNLILNHEFAFFQLSQELGEIPKSKIISFVFKDGAQKGKLFGANNADVAKPWLNQIYVNYSNYRSTLRHELAHVFSAIYGKTFLRLADNFNPVLIEGFATFLDNNYADNDVHFMAKLASESGYKISLKSLFSGLNFFGQTSSISYIYAGSFMKFMSEKYGIEKVKKLYGNLNFKNIFAKDLQTLENEYVIFLKSKDYKINKNTADLFFGRKPIFKRFCARFVANQLRKGFELYKNKELEKAEHIFSEIYKVSDSYSALVGNSDCLTKMDRKKEALNLIKEEIKKFEGTSYFFNLEIVLGNLFAHNFENEKSESIFTKLMEQAPNENYYDLAVSRKLILSEPDFSLIQYLNANLEEKLKIIEEILIKNKSPELVSIYLNLSENKLYADRKEFLQNLGEQIYSANSLFEISKLASENNDFEFAVEMISKAYKFEISENKKIIYRDYLRKYNWFKNFGQQILVESN